VGLLSITGRSVCVSLLRSGKMALSVLTMSQLAKIGTRYDALVRERFTAEVAKLGVTSGQTAVLVRDLLSMEPSYPEIIQFCQTPTGIQLALHEALTTAGVQVTLDQIEEEVGLPLEQSEIAAALVGLRSASSEQGVVSDPSQDSDTKAVTGDTNQPS